MNRFDFNLKYLFIYNPNNTSKLKKPDEADQIDAKNIFFYP